MAGLRDLGEVIIGKLDDRLQRCDPVQNAPAFVHIRSQGQMVAVTLNDREGNQTDALGLFDRLWETVTAQLFPTHFRSPLKM